MIATNLAVGGDVFIVETTDQIHATEPDEPEFPDEYEVQQFGLHATPGGNERRQVGRGLDTA
jgi:hypothetical protein